MDNPQGSVEMPELLRDLAELKERAMHLCRHLTPNGQFELMAIDTAVEILIKLFRAVHLRELEVGQRQLERSLARTQRDEWSRD